VAVHAYVLMSNHIHLLVTPDTADGVPRMMQAVGRSYVRYFNDRHGRSGTLWEGRYRSTLIETERYLLVCMAYIELNPVRAGLAETAADYLWSSHRHNAGMSVDKLVTPHALLWSLGNTPFAREAAYRELVLAGVAPSQQQALTSATLSGWALGSEAFKRGLQDNTLRRIAPAQRGRPPGPAADATPAFLARRSARSARVFPTTDRERTTLQRTLLLGWLSASMSGCAAWRSPISPRTSAARYDISHGLSGCSAEKSAGKALTPSVTSSSVAWM
jgi:putative transposase